MQSPRAAGRITAPRAYAADDLDGRIVKHSFSVAIDDSPETATQEAVDHIRAMYRRDDLTAPESVVDHGRKAGAIVDSNLF